MTLFPCYRLVQLPALMEICPIKSWRRGGTSGGNSPLKGDARCRSAGRCAGPKGNCELQLTEVLTLVMLDSSAEQKEDFIRLTLENGQEDSVCDDGVKYVGGGKKNERKSWIDRSLSNRGRRSSLSSGEEFDLSTMAFKWIDSVGSRFIPDWASKKGKQAGTGRHGTVKKSSVAKGNKRIEPPADFVEEKRAMFAEIDAYELESEEESPISLKVKHDSYVDLPIEIGLKNRRRKGVLEIVPEAGSEELSPESLSHALSAALRTPHSTTTQESSRADFVRSHNSRLRQDLSRHEDFNHLQEPPPGHSAVRTEVVHGWSLDSDEDKRDLKWDTKRFSAEYNRKSSAERRSATDNCEPAGAERVSDHFNSFASRSEKRLSSDVDDLAAGLRGLEFRESLRLSRGRDLKPLVEDRENCERKGSSESYLPQESEESSSSVEVLPEENILPIFEALMKECQQMRPLSLRDAISSFCDISSIVKLGEGTFGEAFKGNGCVVKIVPMDGDILVNGEVQKTAAEIYSEVILTNTLTRLRRIDNQARAVVSNFCTNFIETKRICICQGSYEQELIKAWEEYDAARSSDNDHPMIFRQKQMYVVFVLADGGTDLESFVLSSFSEARSILLQVVLALAVAEEACGFEHRDLHWGNVVISRDLKVEYSYYRLLGRDIRVKTFGISVSIIDFTLSRIDTGKQVFFCNLSNDPELFEGPTRDVQSDTYRRMRNLTGGHWEGSFPKTNCFWIHYLADILLNKKAYSASSQEKRALRSFCKRVLLYESAKDASSDDFFHDLKVVDSPKFSRYNRIQVGAWSSEEV
ncbi:hypothetical protein R1flu_016684 [Riccia fluitans]|uniref:non-specific serine/threonine protein kinase n=1 Tax=Riccia fluitans TaxID=41844 RepID=A0ABD1YMJ0_9MARC